VIRDFEVGDAETVAALLHEQPFPGPVSGRGLLHWLDVQPLRAAARMWVAEEDRLIVGWMRARLLSRTTTAGAGELYGLVAAPRRGRGFGTSLYDAAYGHLRRAEARELRSWSDEDAGRAFLERRGFRPVGAERISTLDLRRAAHERPPTAAGVRLATLRELAEREHELHALYAATVLDVPDVYAEDDIRFDEWRRETLEHPQLSLDGSFVVLVDDRPAAFAFLAVDRPARLAANDMTGTLAVDRGRGLARLAKLATIRWAAAEGYETVVTTNEETNAPMIHLNETLGYRAVGIETQWLKTL
jgi:GNAT superfamily N-acetyltransferase